ncbi:MAG TPA: HAD-IA family hydrolase [Thermoanaerobaculia bacterium]|nr:HAD-IA family hydrolase [Thermoanaerobaculia bacterium]
MGPRAVSFDVTGTLLGLPRLGEIYAEAFHRHGHAVDTARMGRVVPAVWQEMSIRTRLGEDRFSSHPDGAKGFWRELLARVAAHLELPAPTPFLAAELFERFAHADAWEVFADAAAAVTALHAAGLRLAVTSNFDARLPRLLADCGLGDCFDAVVYSEEVGVEKPHPAIFEELLERLGLPAGEVLHVGDSRRDDVEGARAVGMQALWLTRGSQRGDLRRLDELVERLRAAPSRR